MLFGQGNDLPWDDKGLSKRHDPHLIWYGLTEEYYSRKVTVPTDRLPAMSGLASIVHSYLAEEERYVAGLWLKDLHRGLLWAVVREDISRRVRTPQPYISPSWSWASLEGGMIAYWIVKHWVGHLEYGHSWCDELKILNVVCDLKGSNPYGEVSRAVLDVEGIILQALVAKRVKRFFYPEFYLPELGDADAYVDDNDAMQAPQVVWVLAIMVIDRKERDNDYAMCLVVQPSGTSGTTPEQQYERIGVATVDAKYMEQGTRTRLQLI